MMRLGRLRWTAWIAASLLMGCTAPQTASLPPLPPPPDNANGQTLWQIVGKCLRDAKPNPCAEVDTADGVQSGHVVLKDIQGRSQYLVMPTILIPGIEDQRLLAPDAPDYFTPAWRVRALVAQQLGVPLVRDDVGVAVNSIYGRSQGLLHLHVDCLRTEVRDALRQALPTIGHRWSSQPVALFGHGYRAMRIDGGDTVAVNPFQLVSQGLHVPAGEMRGWTILLAGARFANGRPGFILLAARADPLAGYKASIEDLQDHECVGHGAPPAAH